MGDLKRFTSSIQAAIKKLQTWPIRELTLCHHDEADGCTSAAITKTALERRGYKVNFLCIEKLFPQVLEKLHTQKGALIFYTDIGAFHSKLISDLNKGKNLTIILDHHDTEPSTDSMVFNLDPELFGFSGEKDASSATTCYLFAKELDPKNIDLAHLAIIGSAEIPGDVTGLNKIPLEDAQKQDLVEVSGTKGKQRYKVKLPSGKISSTEASSKLSALASVGYYENGPKLAIKACLDGFDESIEKKILELQEKRKTVSKKMLAILYKTKLKETDHIQWFHAKDIFKSMGVKVIGTFCSMLRFQTKLIKLEKYIVGFMNMDPVIPRYGKLEQPMTKVSMRVPIQLEKLINAKKMPGASYLLPEASKLVGGFGDGHSLASSSIIPKGQEEKLIDYMESLFKNFS